MSIVQRQQYWRLELPKSPDYTDYHALERVVTCPIFYSHCTDTCCVYNCINVLSFHCIHRCNGKLMTEYALLSYTVNWSKTSLSQLRRSKGFKASLSLVLRSILCCKICPSFPERNVSRGCVFLLFCVASVGTYLNSVRSIERTLLLLVITARNQGAGCTAAIRLIVHPVF
jgi:hypothetical protein